MTPALSKDIMVSINHRYETLKTMTRFHMLVWENIVRCLWMPVTATFPVLVPLRLPQGLQCVDAVHSAHPKWPPLSYFGAQVVLIRKVAFGWGQISIHCINIGALACLKRYLPYMPRLDAMRRPASRAPLAFCEITQFPLSGIRTLVQIQ